MKQIEQPAALAERKGELMDWDKAASLAMPNAETFRVTGSLPEAGVIVFMRADSTPNITIRPTGEVELAPGLEISEASRLFWQGLADAFPAWRAEVIAAALAERERIRLAEVARAQPQSERMSLRRINHLLAPLELSHQTLADLGFYPTYPPGATLASHPNYSASDFPKICQTISDLAAAAAWDLAAAAAWESQETAEREAYEAAQRKEDAKREEWRAEMRRDVYGEPN